MASILPAKRATRVPPIAAVREGSTLPASRFAAHTHKAGVVIATVSLVALLAGLFAGGLSTIGLVALLGGGVLGVFLGMALLAPRLVTPLARFVGWPARRRGIAGELAGANAVRNPGRTASTAAALMIGLTLVTLVAVLASSLGDRHQGGHRGRGPRRLRHRRQGEPAVHGRRGHALAQVPGVKRASHVRSDTVLIDGKERAISGIDPATIAHFYTFTWAKGSEQSLGKLGTDGAIVKKGYAEDNKLSIGSSIAITMPSGAKRTLVVRGIHKNKTQLLGDVSMTQQAFDQASHEPKNSLTFLEAGPDARTALKAKVAGYGDATFHTGAGFAADSNKQMAKMLSMLYVLLGFSVIVSLFGMVNTLVLSVFERTREIGMLRTIGMTRRQARQMIRHESIITALIGAALGLGTGTALATLVMVKWHLPIALPINTLVGFTLIAVLAGVGAAVMPARRASRLNVLEALQYE